MAEGYGLEPEPTLPDLPGKVIVRASRDEVIDAVAADLLFQALACSRSFGDFHFAASGGPDPAPLYRRLMYDPQLREFPWTRTHLWLTQESRTSASDPQSRFASVAGWLMEHSGIPSGQVHPIPGAEPDAARLYEDELQETLQWREKGHDRLDYALLTLDCAGTLGGTDDRLVFQSEELVSITPRLVTACRFVAVFATGSGARARIAELLGEDRRGLARRLAPIGGELRWYLDRDACPDPA